MYDLLFIVPNHKNLSVKETFLALSSYAVCRAVIAKVNVRVGSVQPPKQSQSIPRSPKSQGHDAVCQR